MNIESEVLQIINEGQETDSLIDKVNQSYAKLIKLKDERITVAKVDSLAGFDVAQGKMSVKQKDDIVAKGHAKMAKLDKQILNMQQELELQIEQVELSLESNPITGVGLFITEEFVQKIKWHCSDIIDKINGTVLRPNELDAKLLNQPYSCDVENQNGNYTIKIKYILIPYEAPCKLSHTELEKFYDDLRSFTNECLQEFEMNYKVDFWGTTIERQKNYVEFRIRLIYK